MNIKKLLALMLVLAMVLCALPVVFAEVAPDAGNDDTDIDLPIQGVPSDEDILYGDANGDGIINTVDTLRMLKYANGETVEILEDAADVNLDGTINQDDVTKVMKYLAGWDVVLGSAG